MIRFTIFKINIMEKINEIKLPEGIESISVTQHDNKIVIEFIPEKAKLKKGDLAIFWDNYRRNTLIRLYNTKSRNMHLDNDGTAWDNAIKWDGTKEQFEKVLRREIN